MATTYKKGQKVKGSTGSRTILKVTPTRIFWKNGEASGNCSHTSFGRWIAGR